MLKQIFRKTLVWLLLYCMWPDLEITLQALSLLHWIKYTCCTDILWENTHRMHVIKVQNSISVSTFRVMPAWLNSPVIVLQQLLTNRKQQVEQRSTQNYSGGKLTNSKLIIENNTNDVQNFDCWHPFGSFNQPVSYFVGLWPSDLVWERHVNAAAGRKMKRRKWDERSEIFLFIHLMPSFLVLVMIVQIFITRWKKKRKKPLNHNRKRTNQIRCYRSWL